jgi:mono/diheme cytochrome c family protein
MPGLLAAIALMTSGCGHQTEQFVLPDDVTDFAKLYAGNCAGCHGADGRSGAARALNDPLYLAFIGRSRLRDVIAKGVPGTAMPAFAQDDGGPLTDNQVGILAEQMEARWSQSGSLAGMTLPAYDGDVGDSGQGEAVFAGYCARCHTGKEKAGSITDPDYLAMVSDQALRTAVVAGSPDWRTYSAAGMTSQGVSNVVAWLAAHRRRRGEDLQ